MKKLYFTLIGLFCCHALSAQTCSCSDLLNQVISKTESNYAGYLHKAKESKDSTRYVSLKKRLRSKAAGTSFSDCYDLLQQYVQFFHDGHLDIFESPPIQPASLSATVKTLQVPADFNARMARPNGKDSVEGIWRSGEGVQIAIFKTGTNRFSGVIQKTSSAKWKPGMVIMEVIKTADNTYSIALYRGDFARLRYQDIHIFKRVSLAMGLYHFAKVQPGDPEYQYIHPADPQLPVLKVLDAKNILLTVPSALIDGRYLDSLLDKNMSFIKSTPNLIIDLRGNGGGNFIWGRLYDLANTIVHPQPKKPGTYDLMLMASEDDAKYINNMSAYYRQVKDSAAIRYYDGVIKNIRDNPGKVMGFSFYQARPDTDTRIVYKYPARIAIITDKAVASAAEAVIIGLKELSSKIVLYGDNTYGMIDYSSVNAIPVGDPACPWYYWGYPAFFATDIKTKPNNPTGIKPDVYVPKKEKDWIRWVSADLNKKFK